MTVIITHPEPACPICGAKMVLRRPRPPKDFRPFWGCGQFPDCKGTRNIRSDGRPESDDYDNFWDED